MLQSIDVQELAIVIVAKQHTPALLNLEFLKCSGIIPADWELARQPIHHTQVSQLLFQNGVSLVAQGNQVIFTELLGSKSLDAVTIANIARRYVEALPQAEYSAAGLNIKGFGLAPDQPDLAHHYLTRMLLSPGAWQDYGQEPVKVGVNFVYTLDGRRLHLSVNEVTLQQQPEGQTLQSLMFDGNFEYRITEGTSQVLQAIQNWQEDLSNYRDLVNTKFIHTSGLAIAEQTEPVTVPDTMPLSFSSELTSVS
jgi:hypothetical protein